MYRNLATAFILLIVLCRPSLFAGEFFWAKINTFSDTKIYSLVIDSNGALYAGTEYGGLYKTSNQGEDWEQFLAEERVNVVMITPEGHIFAGTNENGVFRSKDGGEAWSKINAGIINNQQGKKCVLSLAADSAGRIFAGTKTGGLYRSDDNGGEWTRLDETMFSDITSVQALAVGSGGTVFAGLYNRGVYFSGDHGANWTRVDLSETATENSVKALAAAKGGEGEEYVFAGTIHNGVFRSANDGRDWAQDTNGVVKKVFNYYCFLQDDAGHVFTGTHKAGLYESSDYGGVWEKIAPDISNRVIYSLASESGGVFYAGTDEGLYMRRKVRGALQLSVDMTPTEEHIFDWGETINFSITVLNDEGEPLEGAKVEIINILTFDVDEVFTNSGGWAFYSCITPEGTPRGSYRVEFTASEVDFRDSETITSNVKVMRRDPDMLYLDVTPVEDRIIDLDDSVNYSILVFDYQSNPVVGAVVAVKDGLRDDTYELVSGAEGMVYYTVKAAGPRPNGTYEIEFNAAKDGFNKSEEALRRVELRFNSALKLTIDVIPVEEQVVERGDSVFYTISVSNYNGDPVEAAVVSVIDSLQNNLQFDLETGPGGAAYYKGKVPEDKPYGTYRVEFSASKEGFYPSGPETRLAEVKKPDAVTDLPGASINMNVYPNPASHLVNIDISIPALIPIKLTIVDVFGARLESIAEGYADASRSGYVWNASALPSGVYIIHLQAGGGELRKKLVLTK